MPSTMSAELDDLFEEVSGPRPNTSESERFDRKSSISAIIKPVRPLRLDENGDWEAYARDEYDSGPTTLSSESEYSHPFTMTVRVTSDDSHWTQMSQEVRTVLQSIIGYSEMIAEDLRFGETDHSIDDLFKIKGASEHLLGMVRDIERQIGAERQKRRLAEALSTLLNEAAASSERDQIFAMLIDALREVLPTDELSALVRTDESDLEVAAYWRRAQTPPLARETLKPMIEATAHVDAPCQIDVGSRGSALAVPMLLDSHSAERAVVIVCSHQRVYNNRQTGVALAFCEQVTNALRKLAERDSMRQLAMVDGLTGLLNRRSFFEKAQECVRRAQHNAMAIMMDIDHFKRINDNYGHAAGDDVLREVSQRLQRELREVDVLGRYGGEEFALAVSDISTSNGLALAERLRRSIRSVPIHVCGGHDLRVTVSIGVCFGAEDSLEQMLQHADEALYHSKETGRDRVTSHSELAPALASS